MFIQAIRITLLYFVIGAVMMVMINRKLSDTEKRSGWLKYFTYFTIVHLIIVLLCFLREGFIVLAAVIAAGGAIELIRLVKDALNRFWMAILVYAILVSGFMWFSLLPARSILLVYLVVLIFEGFSQLIGQLIGKRSLVGAISPKKTLEGWIGGVVVAVISVLVIMHWEGWSEIFGTVPGAILFTLFICICATLGDLGASAVKRKTGVKDYGNIIPGHGGILDRFDGFIAAGSGYMIILLVRILAENLNL